MTVFYLNFAVQGKPSKAVVDALAVFGVGAELAVVRTFLKTNIKLANRWAMAWSKWTVMTTLGRLDVLAGKTAWLG